jgi:hypothetical protein
MSPTLIPASALISVHAGLVKPAFGEADHGRLKDLLSAIKDGAGAFRRTLEANNE